MFTVRVHWFVTLCVIAIIVISQFSESDAIKKKMLKKILKASLYGKAFSHSKVIIPLIIPFPFQ